MDCFEYNEMIVEENRELWKENNKLQNEILDLKKEKTDNLNQIDLLQIELENLKEKYTEKSVLVDNYVSLIETSLKISNKYCHLENIISNSFVGMNTFMKKINVPDFHIYRRIIKAELEVDFSILDPEKKYIVYVKMDDENFIEGERIEEVIKNKVKFQLKIMKTCLQAKLNNFTLRFYLINETDGVLIGNCLRSKIVVCSHNSMIKKRKCCE